MAELKTEPAFQLPRSRRPWWAMALVTGAGAGAAIAAALGLSSVGARGAEPPPVRTAGVAVPVQPDAEWRARMEQKLDALGHDVANTNERLARIEGRLERR